jgi:S1-C subfamily serine protease
MRTATAIGTLVAVLTGAIPPQNAQACAVPNAALVQIHGDSPLGPALGAGVIIGRHGDRYTIATSKHVLAVRRLEVTFADGFTTSDVVASVTAPLRDLAIVQVRVDDSTSIVSSVSYPIVSLARLAPQNGAHLSVVGHPLGKLYTHSDATMYRQIEGAYAITCDACNVGDSGGGIFNERNELVGIFTSLGHVGTFSGEKLVGSPIAVSFGEPVDDLTPLVGRL